MNCKVAWRARVQMAMQRSGATVLSLLTKQWLGAFVVTFSHVLSMVAGKHLPVPMASKRCFAADWSHTAAAYFIHVVAYENFV